MAREKKDFDIKLGKLTKSYFWLPQQLKANLLSKLRGEGLGLQKFLSGLVILWLEGEENIDKAVQQINVSVHDRKENRNTGETYVVAKSRRVARKNLITPMNEEELADFFDFTEQQLEKALHEEDD